MREKLSRRYVTLNNCSNTEPVIPAKRSANRNPCGADMPHWILAYARMTAERLFRSESKPFDWPYLFVTRYFCASPQTGSSEPQYSTHFARVIGPCLITFANKKSAMRSISRICSVAAGSGSGLFFRSLCFMP
jgi:hypothetical protein